MRSTTVAAYTHSTHDAGDILLEWPKRNRLSAEPLTALAKWRMKQADAMIAPKLAKTGQTPTFCAQHNTAHTGQLCPVTCSLRRHPHLVLVLVVLDVAMAVAAVLAGALAQRGVPPGQTVAAERRALALLQVHHRVLERLQQECTTVELQK